MKRKISLVVLLIAAILIAVVTVVTFIHIYQPTVDITETKLQLYTFDSYEDGVIHCQGNKDLILDQNAQTLFDETAFLKDISAGEHFFARIDADRLTDGSDKLQVFAVLSSANEYLSLEKLNVKYSASASVAALVLVLGILLAVGAALCSVLLAVKTKIVK